jgi:3-dehydroquinate synthase
MKSVEQHKIVYPDTVIVEEGIFLKFSNAVRQSGHLSPTSKYLFVVDRNFQLHHQDILNQIFINFKSDHAMAVVDAGPAFKSLNGVKSLYEIFYNNNLHRDSVVVAIGGGTLCDVVGFAAATYMRSIKMINIPTTMMSCADPVMGKVGVDHLSQKNLIGAWFFPCLTLVDPTIIKKDVPRYFNTGIAEIIKSVLLTNKDVFDDLERDMGELVKRSNEIIKKYIELSIGIKIKCVRGDEQDSNGQHAKIGLGHTLADVLESKASATSITHGEAVALGMIFAASVNDNLEHTELSKELLDRTVQVLRMANLPTRIPFSISSEEVIEGLLKSKKSRNNAITMVLAKDYGKIEIVERIDPDIINSALKELLIKKI